MSDRIRFLQINLGTAYAPHDIVHSTTKRERVDITWINKKTKRKEWFVGRDETTTIKLKSKAPAVGKVEKEIGYVKVALERFDVFFTFLLTRTFSKVYRDRNMNREQE